MAGSVVGDAGDELSREEFEELLGPHLDLLFGYALRLCRDRTRAEDLLQESIYRAWRGRAGFKRGTNFKAWMFRIVTNGFISSRRSEGRAPALIDLDSAGEPADAAAAVEEELVRGSTDWARVYQETVEDDLKRAVDELPEEFRAPLLLSALGELRYKEIGELLRIPVGTVMSRLFRARQRLRESLRGFASARGIEVGREGGS